MKEEQKHKNNPPGLYAKAAFGRPRYNATTLRVSPVLKHGFPVNSRHADPGGRQRQAARVSGISGMYTVHGTTSAASNKPRKQRFTIRYFGLLSNQLSIQRGKDPKDRDLNAIRRIERELENAKSLLKQLDMIRGDYGEKWQDPYYWAPVVMFGDGS